ncbi:HEPN domain-containing protein [candidate division NPL-UPA2 bacterium Unc8]|uniref:HEPN domain-containing protein n=1 Tax=candidate division NPL-UPA2 bacterium Unc8 TaxID=1980939 RepID=A0A399FU48_UNCN2|nr:MAG: HEPN domain-containing protein [candidate division NPL-UPA2 bacterium Unc8]
MTNEVFTIINYRLGRAKEAIEEAEILLEKGYTNTFVNRLYYACFYTVSALLLTKGLSSAKHSGVRSLFHKHFVKSGVVDVELGQLYDRLFDNRQKGDYADLVKFNLVEVTPWLEEAKKFVAGLEDVIIKKKGR